MKVTGLLLTLQRLGSFLQSTITETVQKKIEGLVKVTYTHQVS